MGKGGSKKGSAEERLEQIIKRMRKIQRNMKASGQPASMLELTELKELGMEYGRIIDRLANMQGGSSLA